MRWPIIRLIWHRELRDQLRDRRTLFVMVLLPLLLYPLGGIALMHIALSPSHKRTVIGLRGAAHLPSPDNPASQGFPSLLSPDTNHPAFADRYLDASSRDALTLALLP
jgi:sodium transport system permease protein